MNPITEWVHPITGITHKACETGWEPEPNSYPGLYTHLKTDRWITGIVPVPEKDRDKFLAHMIRIAKGLSEITGFDIQWHWVPSAENVYGDWGFFKVKK